MPAEGGCSFCVRVARLSDTSRSARGPSKASAREGLSWLWVLEEGTGLDTGCDDESAANPQGSWLWGVAPQPEKTWFRGEAGWQRERAGLGRSTDKTRAHTPIHACPRPHIHAQAHMHARTHTRVHTPRNPCTYIHISFPLPNPAGIF